MNPRSAKKTCKVCNKKKDIPKGKTCKTCLLHAKPSYWKKKAWGLCSIFNRRKDSDIFNDYVSCITCGAQKRWQEVDAGHLVAGRGNAVLFDDRGIHAQCKRCNGPGKGEQYQYSLYVKSRYGEKVMEELFSLKDATLKYSIDDYKRIIEEYNQKIKELDD